VAIKVNLLPREMLAARATRPGLALPTGRLAVGSGLVVQILVGVMGLVAVVLVVMGFMAWSTKATVTKEITELKARNEALKLQLSELRQAEAAKAEIQRRIEVIGRVAKSQGVPVAALNGLIKAIPANIWLTSFEMKPQETKIRVEGGRTGVPAGSATLDKLEAKRTELAAPTSGAAATREVTVLNGYSVVVKGRAFNNLQVADFMENLRKAGVFSDIDFVVTQAERVEQTRVVGFEITASVKL
jgi:Tfp pilus assembly protein PilN